MTHAAAGPDREDVPTLLIVDDEDGVLHAIHETLVDLNYRMILTTDPDNALRILRNEGVIDLLITDLYMPSMDGAELLREGREIRPGLSALLTTGAASSDQLRRWRHRGEVIVAKPWQEEEFVHAVERALRRRKG